MKNRVLDFIREYDMLEAQDKVVTGVSAGPDSVCLLLLLLELQPVIGYEIAVVHVHHNLRGADADADAEFVRELCHEKGLEFGLYSYQVEEIAADQKLSIEEAGRKVRYEAFSDFARKCGGTKIALAHHANDVAETMLHNLARGTGLAGLSSMRPVRGNVIRPLLCIGREEIEHYLEERHIDYRTDYTNDEDHYTRNRIRHHVLDYLASQVNAKAVRHMADAALLIGESQDYLLEQAAKAMERYVEEEKEQIRVSLGLFEEHPVIQKYVLRACIGNLAGGLKDVTSEHLHMLQELGYREVGKRVQLPRNVCAEKEYQAILLSHTVKEREKIQEQCVQLAIPGRVHRGDIQVDCTLEQNRNTGIPEKRYTKWLDYDKIKGEVMLRNRRPGDYLVINQEQGTQKLKDFFINQKIPQKERDGIWLLAAGSEVLWIIGHRLNAYYKVSSGTEKILKIQVQGGNTHE